MSSNVSFGGCGSVCAHAQLSPFYLLSTPRRQSRDKLYQAFRSLNFLRVKGRQRERMAWERGYHWLSLESPSHELVSLTPYSQSAISPILCWRDMERPNQKMRYQLPASCSFSGGREHIPPPPSHSKFLLQHSNALTTKKMYCTTPLIEMGAKSSLNI